MSQTIGNTNSRITIIPISTDYNDILADGNNFATIQCHLYYYNNQNINITGILNLQGDNGDLQTANIDFSPTGELNSDKAYLFKVTSTSPATVTYKATVNTSIGNLNSVSSVKINFLENTPQNQKIVVASGAINNRLVNDTTPPSSCPKVCPSCPQTVCPDCPQPVCPKPSCPACPTPPACPACVCPTIPINTQSSLSGSTDPQKCEIDYTPIIIIGVLIIILLLILLYLQLTNKK